MTFLVSAFECFCMHFLWEIAFQDRNSSEMPFPDAWSGCQECGMMQCGSETNLVMRIRTFQFSWVVITSEVYTELLSK